MGDLTEILRTALSLGVEDRAALAAKLLESLEDLGEEEAERLWVAEAERRLGEARGGRARVLPSEEVHERARRSLA